MIAMKVRSKAMASLRCLTLDPIFKNHKFYANNLEFKQGVGKFCESDDGGGMVYGSSKKGRGMGVFEDREFLHVWRSGVVPNGFGEQENLEEFLMNDEVNGDLGDLLELDDLFPVNSVEPFGVLLDSESEIEIGLEDFSGNMEDLLDEQAS
ncbi:hypothetical protein Tco_0716530 [Tanacetum coccineum]